MKTGANFRYYFIFCVFFISLNYAMDSDRIAIPDRIEIPDRIAISCFNNQCITTFKNKNRDISVVIFPNKDLYRRNIDYLCYLICTYIQTSNSNSLFDISNDAAIDLYTKIMCRSINKILKESKVKNGYGEHAWLTGGAYVALIMKSNNIDAEMKIVCIGNLNVIVRKGEGIFSVTTKKDGPQKIIYDAFGFFKRKNEPGEKTILIDPFVVTVNKKIDHCGKVDWICIQSPNGLNPVQISDTIAQYQNSNNIVKIITTLGIIENIQYRIPMIKLFPIMQTYLCLLYPFLSHASVKENRKLLHKKYKKLQHCLKTLGVTPNHPIIEMFNNLKNDCVKSGLKDNRKNGNIILKLLFFGKNNLFFRKVGPIDHTISCFLNDDQTMKKQYANIQSCINVVKVEYDWYEAVLKICQSPFLEGPESCRKRYMVALCKIANHHTIQDNEMIKKLDKETNIISFFIALYKIKNAINEYCMDLKNNVGNLTLPNQKFKNETTHYGTAFIGL